MSDDCDFDDVSRVRKHDDKMNTPKDDMKASFDMAMRETGWQPSVEAACIGLAWRLFELLYRINELPYTTLPASLREEVAAICGTGGKSQ